MTEARRPVTAVALVCGQATSALGSAVTGFGMNVWVYETTGSFALFATMAVVAALPALLIAPVAGVVVDRVPKRTVLLCCQGGGAALLAVTLAVTLTGALDPVLVGVLWCGMSVISAFSWPAVAAAITGLTTARQRPKVNGLAETLTGVVTIGSPVLGAGLYGLVGIAGIAAFDLVSFAACTVLLLALRFPATPQRRAGAAPATFRADLAAAWRFLTGRPDLLRLLGFFVLVNVGLSIFAVLYSPYVLSFAGPGLLGVLLALGGAGTVLGGVVYAATGGPGSKEFGVLAGAALAGVCMAAFGLLRADVLLAVAAFLYGASVPLLNASSQTIWQARTPPELQGRVFSLRRMIAWGFNPFAIALSVPLAEVVFAPLTGDGSVLAGLWGAGTAGTFGLTATFCGLVAVVVVAVTAATGGLRAPVAAPTPL